MKNRQKQKARTKRLNVVPHHHISKDERADCGGYSPKKYPKRPNR